MTGWTRLPFVALAALLSMGFTFPWRSGDSAPERIAGMARRTEIHIAPEVNGRLLDVTASPGQHFEKGAVLATLDNPDLAAAVDEAEAALANARANRANVYSGVRPEEVAIAAEAVKTAEANLTLAQQQNVRVAALAVRGFNSRAQLDESNAALAKGQAELEMKRSEWAAAKAGPTAEERQVADANAALAVAALDDLHAQLGKTRLLAPAAGAVGMQVAQIGEVVTPGKPVLTFAPDAGLWFAFTIREDDLHGLDVGSKVTLRTTAGGAIEARLTELRPLGEFATWRAARAVGDHDLNSFRVRFDPAGETQGIEPGMTVFLTPPLAASP
jgi:multidrug resistance efflux pump